MGTEGLRKVLFSSPDSVYFLWSHFRSQFSVLSVPRGHWGQLLWFSQTELRVGLPWQLELRVWLDGAQSQLSLWWQGLGRGPLHLPLLTLPYSVSVPTKDPTQWPPEGGEGGGGAHSRGWGGGEEGLHLLRCPVRLKPHSCRSTRSSRPEAGWAPSFMAGWLGQNDPPWWPLLWFLIVVQDHVNSGRGPAQPSGGTSDWYTEVTPLSSELGDHLQLLHARSSPDYTTHIRPQ